MKEEDRISLRNAASSGRGGASQPATAQQVWPFIGPLLSDLPPPPPSSPLPPPPPPLALKKAAGTGVLTQSSGDSSSARSTAAAAAVFLQGKGDDHADRVQDLRSVLRVPRRCLQLLPLVGESGW